MNRRGLRSVTTMVTVLVLFGCGVTPNSEPQQIAIADVPEVILDPELTTTTTAPATALTEPFQFYLAQTDDDRTVMVPVERPISLEAAPSEVLNTLLDLVPSEEEDGDGLTTRIPEGTQLVSTPSLDPQSNVLTLDFTEELVNESQGDLQISAFAQIVYTVTGLEGVTRVRFLVQGEAIEVRVDGSSTTNQPVDRVDYASFRP